MTYNFTVSIISTASWAWVFTLLVDTGQITRTFRVADALWPTIRRSSKVIGLTSARW